MESFCHQLFDEAGKNSVGKSSCKKSPRYLEGLINQKGVVCKRCYI